jgi:uncharacterized protein (TIGR02145 family)
LGSSSISDDVAAKDTADPTIAVFTSSSKGNVDYATANPEIFIQSNSSNYFDWHYSSRNNDLWKSSKTIYDPCPAGWRVPDGGENGVWSKACGSSDSISDYPYDSTDKGMNFSGKFGSASIIWYPASGYRSGGNYGVLLAVAEYGEYWSVTPSSKYAYYLSFSEYGYVYPSRNFYRADGRSVRCLKISEINGDNEGFGGSDYEW